MRPGDDQFDGKRFNRAFIGFRQKVAGQGNNGDMKRNGKQKKRATATPFWIYRGREQIAMHCVILRESRRISQLAAPG